jgi:hypothetical protein
MENRKRLPRGTIRSEATAAGAQRPADIGGIGMLLKSIKEEAVVLVEDLTPGEPAALSGRIRIGDRLLVVNGVEVTPQNFDLVSAMIPGPSGTRVDLQFIQGADALHSNAHAQTTGVVYSVSLLRSVLGSGRSRAAGLVSSPIEPPRTPSSDDAKMLVV